MTANEHGPSTIGGRQVESVTYTTSGKLTGDSLAEHLLEPVQNISEGLDQVAVLSGLPDSAPSCASSSKPRNRGEPKRSSAKLQREATFANFNICSTICNESWMERETAIADLLYTTEDAKYCTVGYRRQRRTEAAYLLVEAEVIFSSNSVIRAGLLPWNTPLRGGEQFLQHQSQVCPIRSTGPVWRKTSELRTRDLDCHRS